MVSSNFFEEEKFKEEEELLEEGSISAEEEGFLRGYAHEEKIIVCDECGLAIHGKPLFKTIEKETYCFCSQECVKEFEENLD